MSIPAFTKLVGFTDLEGLEYLHKGLSEGRVVKRIYQKDQNSGCLIWFLSKGCVTSREARHRYYAIDPDLVVASDVVVRSWDDGSLSEADVRAVLESAIIERKAREKEAAARDKAHARHALPA